MGAWRARAGWAATAVAVASAALCAGSIVGGAAADISALVGQWNCSGTNVVRPDLDAALSAAGNGSLASLGPPGSEAWTSALEAALSPDGPVIMTVPFIYQIDNYSYYFGVTWLPPDQFDEANTTSGVIPGIVRKLLGPDEWKVTSVGTFDEDAVRDVAQRIDEFYLIDENNLQYQALAPGLGQDNSVGARTCTRAA
mmetsp:Transcript_9136/g.37415  ORF Transcript_9136/g.37415 Transcript_9136/m.37415 type:complete len:197 (-) Transcript_9136:297-887(-)